MRGVPSPFISSDFSRHQDHPPQALRTLSAICEILSPWDTQGQVNQVNSVNQVDGVVAAVTRTASCEYCEWLPCVSQGGDAGITQTSLEVAVPC